MSALSNAVKKLAAAQVKKATSPDTGAAAATTTKNALPKTADNLADSGFVPPEPPKRPNTVSMAANEQQQANDKYEQMFKAAGGLEDDGSFFEKVGDFAQKWWDDRGYHDGAAVNARLQDPTIDNGREAPNVYKDAAEQWRSGAIDDGRLNRSNVTSDLMTGDRYIEYAKAGFGGRDISEIDPTKVYSKTMEEQLGFTPYVPDNSTFLKHRANRLALGANTTLSGLAGIRENLTDYDITLPSGETITGRQFDPYGASDWVNAQERYFEGEDEIDPSKMTGYVYDIMDTSDPLHPVKLGEQTASFVGARAYPSESGSIILELSDGNKIEFPGNNRMTPEEQYRAYKSPESYQEASTIGRTNFRVDPDQSGSSPYWMNDYFLDDVTPSNRFLGTYDRAPGQTRLTYDDVNGVLRDLHGMGSESDNEDEHYASYDFDLGPLKNFKKPAAFTKEKFLSSDFIPKTFDMTASSLPYFNFGSSIPYGLSNAYAASLNLNPMQNQNAIWTGEYEHYGDLDEATREELTRQDIDPDQYMENRNYGDYYTRVAANAAMPFTEVGWGNIGGKVKNPLVGVLRNKFGDTRWMPVAEELLGVVGEGAEEIPGNIVEEGSQYGLSDWYGDYLKDQNGDILYDTAGHPLKRQDTSIAGRGRNFWGDTPESFAGGMILGAGMGALSTPAMMNRIKANHRFIKDTGHPYKPYRQRMGAPAPEIGWDIDADAINGQ